MLVPAGLLLQVIKIKLTTLVALSSSSASAWAFDVLQDSKHGIHPEGLKRSYL